MTLYIDIENKKLVQSLTSDRAVSAPVFMQGDNEPLQIHMLEKGEEELFAEKPLTVGTDFLRVAIARFKGYPKRGLPELYYSLEVAPMYACNCGGSVDLIFTKVS